MSTVLVTGATGNVGSELVGELVRRGRAVRAAVRRPSGGIFPEPVEVVAFDFRDPATFGPALAGIDQVFLVRPPAMSDPREMRPFIRAVVAAGVRHVVFLSLQGAERNPVVPHFRIERYLRASGLTCTFLRPSFFMQNLSTTHRADICERAEVFVPAGSGATSFIDTRDIAEAAAVVLTQPDRAGRPYTLTGPEALTYGQVAAILSDVTGRTIRYTSPSGAAFARRMRDAGHEGAFVTVMRGIYTVARLGMAGRVTGDLARLVGRPGRTFAEFARDNASLFSPSQGGRPVPGEAL